MSAELWAVGLVLASTIIGSVGSVLLKIGSGKIELKLKSLLQNYKLIFGYGMYGFSAIIFVVALKGGDLTVLYPLTSLTYVWVVLLSKFILNEKINLLKVGGIALILVGIAFIGRGSI